MSCGSPPEPFAAVDRPGAGGNATVAVALAVAPLILFAAHAVPILPWLRDRWAAQPDTAALFLLLLGGCGWALAKLRRQRGLAFEFRALPCLGLLLTLALSLLNRRSWAIGSLEALLALAGAYSLAGLYIAPLAWRRAAIVLALLCLSLPVQDHVQDLAGFPFRVLTAAVVAQIMSLLGVPSLSQASLVLSAGSVAAVDYPCSGLRFLHAGSVFLGAVLLLGRVRRLRAGLCALGFLLSLVLLNVWRVFCLVYLFGVLGLGETAERVHTALGAVGFTACCAALLFVLRPSLKVAPLSSPSPPAAMTDQMPRVFAPAALSGLIASVLCLDALPSVPRPGGRGPSVTAPALRIPDFALQPLPLEPLERDYYAQRGVETAGKFALVEERTGEYSTLLVTVSVPWYVQHAPERCVRGSGRTIRSSDVLRPLEQPGTSSPALVRRLVLDGGESSLLYWFTDGREMVPDYGSRVWSGLRGARRPWALIEVMTVGVPDARSPQVWKRVLAVERAVRVLLAREGSAYGDRK